MLRDERFLEIVEATPLVSIDLIVRNRVNQVLLGKRVNRPAQGFWFVPGGRIRKNERVAEALKRISGQELGVTIEKAALRGVFNHIYEDNFLGKPGVNTHYVVLAHEYRLPIGIEVRSDEQHSEIRWWNVDAILGSPEVHENTKVYFRG